MRDGKAKMLRDSKMVKYGFTIKDLGKLMNKILIITGDFDHCMTIYHSDLDDGRGIKKKYLLDTQNCLSRLIQLK